MTRAVDTSSLRGACEEAIWGEVAVRHVGLPRRHPGLPRRARNDCAPLARCDIATLL